MTYNGLGQEIEATDPLGPALPRGSHDQLGDLAGQVDPGGGVWTYTYDPAGEQTSVTDPTGAQTQATYDGMGQNLATTTQPGPAEHLRRLHHHLRLQRRGRAGVANHP